MRRLQCAFILFIAFALVAPAAVHSTEGGEATTAVRNPRKKPPPTRPGGDSRPPRRKDEPKEDTGGTRETRPQEPIYVPEQPVVQPIVIHHRCHVCMRYEVYCSGHGGFDEPLSVVGVYAAATASTAIVNLMVGVGGPPDEQLAVAGFVLGGVSFLAASVVHKEQRAYYAVAGLASVGLAVLNLISDPGNTPDRSEPVRSSLTLLTLSF